MGSGTFPWAAAQHLSTYAQQLTHAHLVERLERREPGGTGVYSHGSLARSHREHMGFRPSHLRLLAGAQASLVSRRSKQARKAYRDTLCKLRASVACAVSCAAARGSQRVRHWAAAVPRWRERGASQGCQALPGRIAHSVRRPGHLRR